MKTIKKQLKTSEQSNKELKSSLEKLSTDAQEKMDFVDNVCQTDETTELNQNQVKLYLIILINCCCVLKCLTNPDRAKAYTVVRLLYH